MSDGNGNALVLFQSLVCIKIYEHSSSWNSSWDQVRDRLGRTKSQGKGSVFFSEPLVPFCGNHMLALYLKVTNASLLSLLVELEVSNVPHGDILTHIFLDELHPESFNSVLRGSSCLHSFQRPAGYPG